LDKKIIKICPLLMSYFKRRQISPVAKSCGLSEERNAESPSCRLVN